MTWEPTANMFVSTRGGEVKFDCGCKSPLIVDHDQLVAWLDGAASWQQARTQLRAGLEAAGRGDESRKVLQTLARQALDYVSVI